MGLWNIIRPEAFTNLVTNPSFETNTTGWAASGTNTIAVSTDYAAFGVQSLKCTYQDNTTLATLSSITLTAAEYVYTAWVYLASNWDGGAVQLAISGFTSAVTDTATTTTTTTGQWVQLFMTFTPDAGDLVGALTVETASAPTAGRIVYVDGVTCGLGDGLVTHTDGDQPGCSWNGTAHASTSARDQFEHSGGKILNFDTDLSAPVEDSTGFGFSPVNVLSSELALADFGLYEKTTFNPRVGTMKFTINNAGATVASYHSTRQTLERLFFNQQNKITERAKPRRYIYTGATRHKYLDAVYASGLESGREKAYAEEFSIRLMAHDPFWYALDETAAALANGSTTARYFISKINEQWGTINPTNAPTTAVSVYAILHARDGKIYVGGDFTGWNNIAGADYIVRYNPETPAWELAGDASDLNGTVWALDEDATGNIYAVGEFTNAGGDANADYIATFDGTSWSALGTPSSGATISAVYAVHFATNGNLYVGGNFTNLAGIAAADYTAYWDGSSWNAVTANAINNHVRAITSDSTNVYFGGLFTTFDGETHNYAVLQVISSGGFNDIVSTQLDGAVYAMDIAPSGNLFIGGDFTLGSGADTVTRIAYTEFSTWRPLPHSDGSEGANDIPYAISIADDGLVYFGGAFTTVGNLTIERVCTWDGSVISPLDVDLPSSPTIRAIDTNNDDVYLGFNTSGTANHAGVTTISYIGTAKAYPTITIERSTDGTSSSLQTITNTTTGAILDFDGYSLVESEKLTIVARPGSESIVSSQFGNITGTAITPESNLGNFFLLPGANSTQDNIISIYTVDVGSPTVTIFIRWRDTFLGQS